jgi:chromosome segregation ATPase
MVKSRVLWMSGVLGGVASVAALSGQAQRPAATTDDLLAEVRALRSDVNQAAGASVRMQLLIARLQLQEQRIHNLGTQLTDVRRQLGAMEGQIKGGIAEISRMEEVAQSPSTPQPERLALDHELEELKAQMAQAARDEQALRLREGELASALSAEQGRWMDLNGRLDDLERALPGVGVR